MADDSFLEQEVDDAGRVYAVDDSRLKLTELQLQVFIQL